MDTTEKYSRLLVDLDSILDTRLATICSFGEDLVVENLTIGYYNRVADIFKGIDSDTYNERYKNRTKLILKNAFPTNIVNLLARFPLETMKASYSGPLNYTPVITVNIFPYKLNSDEINLISNIVRYITNEVCRIEIVNYEISELSPSFLKDNFDMVIMYDYISWMEIMSENKKIINESCPSVTMIAPKVFFREPPSNIEEQNKVYDLVMATLNTVISLELYDIEFFCISRKVQKSSET